MADRDEMNVRNARPLEDEQARTVGAGRGSAAAVTGGPRRWVQQLQLHTTRRINPTVVANFWVQLALLIEVGVPLLKALRQVEGRTSHPWFRPIIHQVAEDIEGGESFSGALARQPDVFSKLTVQVIKVAERGGVLENSLRLVANELERHAEIRSKVKRALAYPAMITGIGIAVVAFVLAFVIPQFTDLFKGQNISLPLPTRIIVGAANFFASYWWLCVLGLIVLWVLFRLYTGTSGGRLVWDRLKLRLPLFGNLLTKASVLRFAQTLGTLLRGGVPILVSLKLVQENAENSVLSQELEAVYAAVEQGSRVEEPLRRATVFPAMAVDMIAIGEEGGQLDTVLFKIAGVYKEEIDHTVSIFSSIIEPLLLLIMGVFVALIVWAVYLPYFQLPGILGD
ncbi:MAG: type II secretion system F family protein [Nitrospinae bacterium]|nr:type II secretion system F family protein [Nitrospinota bacterium]